MYAWLERSLSRSCDIVLNSSESVERPKRTPSSSRIWAIDVMQLKARSRLSVLGGYGNGGGVNELW